MRIGILSGYSRVAQLKAKNFYDSIKKVGHDATVFCRAPMSYEIPHYVAPTLQEMWNLAYKSDCEFFMTTTDAIGDILSRLNQSRNKPYFPEGSNHKDKLHLLTHDLDSIQSWNTIDDVPDKVPIFIKPNMGSGSEGGDPWAYKKYDSKEHFIESLKDIGGLRRFNYAQANAGWMGQYVFQEYLPHDYVQVRWYLNDGIPMSFVRLNLPAPYADKVITYHIDFDDDFKFAHNSLWGTLTSVQAIPTKNKSKINDFNLRCAASWTVTFQKVCPNFYDAYFNNLLNPARINYEFKCKSFTLVPPNFHHEYNLNDFIITPDIPYLGDETKMGIIFND
jgi:hypothetical protein